MESIELKCVRCFKGFSSLVLPRSLAGFALSFGCGEHCWLSLKGKI